MRLTLLAVLAAATLLAQTQTPLETKSAPGRGGRVSPPARILSFEARPSTVKAGEQVTLVWATENPNGVSISGIGKVTPRGSKVVTPRETTTYTLTVTGPARDTVSLDAKVTVSGTLQSAAKSAATAAVPDLNGVYDYAGFGGGGRGGAQAAGPELKPGAEQYRVVRGPNEAGPLSDCMPVAGPAAFSVPYQFQIIQNKDYVVILHEYPNTHRIVPINGQHPVDPDPTWLGDSVGKWDGDTLVVDTIGFNDRTELSGFRHTEALHIVERFRKNAEGALEYEATLEDPNVFVKPWTVTRTYPVRMDLAKIGEFVCENNKPYDHLFAK